MKKTAVTRRDFLRIAALSPVAGAFSSGWMFPSERSPQKRSRVVLIRDEKAQVSFQKFNPDVIQKMMDDAVSVLLDEKDPLKAWAGLVTSTDVVGIKSNVWSYIPTPRELEEAVKQRIRNAGVPERNIAVDDRGVRNNPVFQKATALINARPARTHHWSGVGSCIKNYIMFVPRPEAYHGDACADLASIWKDYGLKGKTKLNILVMMTPLFHGIGPHHFSRKYVWNYNGILVGQDPVAVDSVGLRILQAKRREFFGDERPLRPLPKHVFLADTRHHLGTANPDRIELVKLGWKEGILI